MKIRIFQKFDVSNTVYEWQKRKIVTVESDKIETTILNIGGKILERLDNLDNTSFVAEFDRHDVQTAMKILKEQFKGIRVSY